MISNDTLGRIRKAVHEQKFDKPPRLRLTDVESLLDAYDQLVLQASAGLVGMQVTWRDPEGDPPANYVPVLAKLQDGYVRLARKGANYWAYAEFTHDSYTRNKYPPISQPSNPVVGWLPILPDAEQDLRKVYVCDVCQGIYADEPVSQCDCTVGAKTTFSQGYIVMPGKGVDHV